MTMLDDETHYKILKLLQEDPHISQRALADALGVSLGKTNFCLRALIDRGLIKARNFRNSRNKSAYAYFLTPQGISEKASVTIRFLKRKMAEHEILRGEIERLRTEVGLENPSPAGGGAGVRAGAEIAAGHVVSIAERGD